MSYQTIPQTVEAVQWNGENVQEITTFLEPAGLITLLINFSSPDHLQLQINTTATGNIAPEVSDWLVSQGSKFFTMTDADFHAAYEEMP